MDIKESAIVETKNLAQLYSAQFEYNDLVSRLQKIKKSREIGTKGLFRSFDSSLNTRPTYVNRERVRIISNHKPVMKQSVKSKVREKRDVKKSKHHKSISDKFYQSELIPLLNPGFKVYYKHNVSMGRRVSS
jgi:hypothetical protein